MSKVYILLIFIPISVLFHFMHIGSSSIQFLVTALAIIPLARLLGEGTEELSKYTGEKLGGFLCATFGNATELILSLFALKEGLFDVVRASIAGSMIGNILLVLGVSMLVGGTKFKTQNFSKKSANSTMSLLILAVISLVIPTVCTGNLSRIDVNPANYMSLSVAIAIVMLIVYLSSLYFSFFTHKDIYGVVHESAKRWSKSFSSFILLIATIFVAIESELLVKNIVPMTGELHLSKLFVGLIIIPIIGNAAEHSTAVMMAVKNKIAISVEIAIGSSLQIILFVAPLLVLVSILFKPMTLIFNTYEILSLIIAVVSAKVVCEDGESNWLEGLQLVSIYVVLAVTFYMI